jgi:small-conductance mechanosensitive channel
VKNLGLVSVTLATRSKDEVTIPNTVIVTGAITNSSRGHSATFAMSTSVNVGYDTPWRQVQALLLLAAARTDGVQQAPAPTVFQTALSDFYITYELVAYGDATASRPVVLSRLHERILDVFNEHGVQIMSPNFEAQPDRRVVVDPSQWFADPATHPDRRSDS